jgi:hypothetical protein
MVRNESVRFGRHIDIEVSYKILQLEIPNLVLILHYLACFQKGLFGGNFPLGVKYCLHPKLLECLCLSQIRQHVSQLPKIRVLKIKSSFWDGKRHYLLDLIPSSNVPCQRL